MKKQIVVLALAAALLALSACGAQSNSAAGGGTVSRESGPSSSGYEENNEGSSMAKQDQKEGADAPAGAASSAQVPEENEPGNSDAQDQPGTAGGDDQPQAGVLGGNSPVSQPEPRPEPQPQAVEEPKETPADPEPQEPVPALTGTSEDAMAYIGQSASSLIAAIGRPNGSSYAPSCMGDGEDGELYYNGFTVYTYRENGTEIVQDVLGA